MKTRLKSLGKIAKKPLKKLKSLIFPPRQGETNPLGELLGFLESPNFIENNTNGTLRVSGWVLHKTAKIAALRLGRDNLPEEDITYGTPRPDVAKVFPDMATACESGFGCNIALGRNYTGKLEIKIWAILENEERLCCFGRTVKVRSPSPPRSVNLSLFIYGVINKAFVAYRQKRLPLSPIAWVRYLRRYYRQLNAYQTLGIEYSNIIHPWQTEDPYQRWLEINSLTPKLRSLMQQDAERLKDRGVKISVIVPVYNTPPAFLEEAIASVTTQIYPNWELCLADDCSSLPHIRTILEKAQASDSRIKISFRTENGHIAAATNSALDLATGEYVAFLDHDDLLPPDSLLHLAEAIDQHPDIDWIYTDEDKIDAKGYRYGYQMKGTWSPEMGITHNYMHHLAAIRKSLVEKVGRMRPGFEGAQDLDLFLRVSEQTTSDRIIHLPYICYHWRVHEESTASRGTQKSYVFDSAYRAIAQAITRRGLKAKPFLPAIAKEYGLCLHQLQWDSSILAENNVTVIIPTRDRVDLLAKCISRLEKTVDGRYVKLIVVDDRSVEPKTHQYLEKLETEKVLNCRVIRAERPDGQFNYARLVNLAIDFVETPLILHLNNDIEAIAPGWLEDMAGWMSIEGVGVVGAKLLYPDKKIQHAGVVVGVNQGLAAPLFNKLHKDELGYIFLPHAARNLLAVTGACLLTSTELYKELRGFDAENLGVEFNDVDYCLRIIESGKRVVYTPQATLSHHESASRKNIDYNPREHLNFLSKYRGYRDPFFNENLDIDNESKAMRMDINPWHCNRAKRVSKIQILLITHNLNLEGAPLMAYRFAEYFAQSGCCQIKAISLADGPLRSDCENLQIPVKIIEDDLKIVDANINDYRQRLQKLGESLDIAEFDLIICNTMVAFWGIELARLFGLPSIWHIHESCTVEKSLYNFFGESPAELIKPLLEECFTKASRVVFVAEATRRIFHPLDSRGNFRTVYGGLDIDKINQYRQNNQKSDIRAKYGIDDEKIVITLVGTICERKGQHIFVEAIAELEKKYLGNLADLYFIIVGPRQEVYFNFLQQRIQQLNLKNLTIYEETREIYDFYKLSDIFVCASFEESFPRVVLEAMAFELKIVSTGVFGIAEMIGDREHGYLVPPGDPQALAAALLDCLSDPKASQKMAAKAYARVCRMFNNQLQLPKHLELAKEVALMEASE